MTHGGAIVDVRSAGSNASGGIDVGRFGLFPCLSFVFSLQFSFCLSFVFSFLTSRRGRGPCTQRVIQHMRIRVGSIGMVLDGGG